MATSSASAAAQPQANHRLHATAQFRFARSAAEIVTHDRRRRREWVPSSDGIPTLILGRGKVNAINGAVVEQLREILKLLERDPDIRAVLLTGAGNFFSFGFDIPEFLSFSREQFAEYLTRFTELYTYERSDVVTA